jgi:hypothetical protein
MGRPLAARRGRVGSFVNKNLALGNFIAADLFLAGRLTSFYPLGITMFDDPLGAGVAAFPLPSSGLAAPIRSGLVVAIPVKDEEERLPACLRALAHQLDRSGQPIPPTLVRVVLFANNCTDQSAHLGRSLGELWSLDIRVFEASLPQEAAHAGAARRAAMDLAETWLEEGGERDGVILTADADSQVAPSWIAENLAAFEAGAEAALGRIDLDGEGKFLPEALDRRGALKDRYARLLTELFWLLDPLEHNPWPHHATISGASLGVRRTAYCRVGRLPRVALGEDKALIALLSCQDARIRYGPTVRAITSGRTHGARREVSRTRLRSEARSRSRFATTPWSRSTQRSPAPYGGDGCADCMPRAASHVITIGRLRSDSQPATSMTSSESPVRRCVEHHRESGLCARGQDFSTFQPGAPMPMDQPQSICVIRVPDAKQLARPRFLCNQFDPLVVSAAKHHLERVDMSLKQPP